MHRSVLPSLSLALLLSTSVASALDQPNGTPIPQGNGLQGLFTARGEAINALQDAAAVPETFQPSCSLTFTVLQRNAGYQNAFGWYNVTGSVPPLSDLHEFIKCSDPLNSVNPLPNIKQDPAYLGGEIGFYEGVVTSGCNASTGPANYAYVFYSQKALNPDGNQANPYVHLLVYNSTVTPNAFYFGWEDLLSGGDNDFDDLTTFVTGITCSGGGGACQTGQPGVCADGTQQCQNGMLACVQSVMPTAEKCDGFDNDCNALVDDGDLCAQGEVCDNGNCVPTCSNGEFQCPSGTVCDVPKGLCVTPACSGVSCPDGSKCVMGDCVQPCTGAVCPSGQTCIAGSCVDPCTVIQCDDSQVCSAGACIDKCACAGCAAGNDCQPSGLCSPTACAGVTCPPGATCQLDGTCKDGCDGVTCPAGQVCTEGQCVIDPGTTSSSTSTTSGGLATSSTATASGAGGASSGSASGTAAGGAGGSGNVITQASSNCDCRVGGSGEGAGGAAIVVAIGLGASVARRRRGVRRP